MHDPEFMRRIYGISQLPLARLLKRGELNPDTVESAKDLIPFIEKLGSNHETSFEVYLDNSESRLKLIRSCMDEDHYDSASILLHALIEEKINEAIRLSLSFRNMTHNRITSHLKTTSSSVKLELIIPLLEIRMPEFLKNLYSELTSIRNDSAHNKSIPSIYNDFEDKDGSHKINAFRAKDILMRTNFDSVTLELEKLHLNALESIPEFIKINEMLNRVLEKKKG